jgi:periplasmic copper chaperone A
MRFSYAFAAGIAAGAFLSVSSAFAHVTLDTRDAPTDSYYKAVFNVPHGCEGSSTTSIRIRLPEGLQSVKVQPKQGWKVSTVKTKLPTPVTGGHGEAITETISEVSWTGGLLLDEHIEEFMMQIRLPNAAPGTVLYFPVVQECEKGVNRWIELPEAGKSLKQPAPSLRLIAK